MCDLFCHIFLVLGTLFFHGTALSRTNGVEGDTEKLRFDETPAAVLVRRENGLAFAPALVEALAIPPDASKYPSSTSPSLVASGESPSPPQEALSPAPPAAPPVDGQPGIENWGPTEAPATDHTALICIIVGFILVTIVAALIPFFVKRFGSEVGKDGTEDSGGARGGKSASYQSQRKRQALVGPGSSSEEDAVGGKSGSLLEPASGSYGSRRKRQDRPRSGSSSEQERKEVEDPRPYPQSGVEENTQASQEAEKAKSISYKEGRAKRKGDVASSKGAVEASNREESLGVTAQLVSGREAGDEDAPGTKMQTPLLASDTQSEGLSPSSSSPSRSYKQDRATRKAQASSASGQLATPSPIGSSTLPIESSSPEVQREVSTEGVPSMAASRYGAERKRKKQEEPQI